MTQVITNMTVTHDVALVTLNKVPSSPDFISRLFLLLKEKGINVDMISQTALTGPYVALSFTAGGEDIGKIMEILQGLRLRHPEIKPLLSSNNVKISLYGADMPKHAGIAAGVFEVLAGIGGDLLLITTSSVDISVLVNGAFADECCAALKEKYNL